RALAQKFGERVALDQLHDEIGASVGELSQLMRRWNSRMLQLSGDARLFQKAPAGAGPGVREEDLDRQRPIEGRVVCPQHHTHPTAGDLADNSIAITGQCPETIVRAWSIADAGGIVRANDVCRLVRPQTLREWRSRFCHGIP